MEKANTAKEVVLDKYNEKTLKLVPKLNKYVEYILDVTRKLPRAERFSMGTMYKSSLYQLIEDVMYLNKLDKAYILMYLNKIDALLNAQRCYLRIMQRQNWIEKKRFNEAMKLLSELGMMLGGIYKYNGKNN